LESGRISDPNPSIRVDGSSNTKIYSNFILAPIDLSGIQRKVLFKYQYFHEFYEDMELLVNNAYKYYNIDSKKYKEAQRLWASFTEIMETLGHQQEVSRYYDMDEKARAEFCVSKKPKIIGNRNLKRKWEPDSGIESEAFSGTEHYNQKVSDLEFEIEATKDDSNTKLKILNISLEKIDVQQELNKIRNKKNRKEKELKLSETTILIPGNKSEVYHENLIPQKSEVLSLGSRSQDISKRLTDINQIDEVSSSEIRLLITEEKVWLKLRGRKCKKTHGKSNLKCKICDKGYFIHKKALCAHYGKHLKNDM
jgi:hypothetical protein